MSERLALTSRLILATMLAPGITAIHQQVSRSLQVPSEKRKTPERGFGDDPKLQWQCREENRDVVDALMIGGEDVALGRIDQFKPGGVDANTGRLENQPRPAAGAAVTEISRAIHER